ncbi:MAG: hypothetical protein Q8L29_00305 [archaeon]|nr:hypothetical protein [archaeon]
MLKCDSEDNEKVCECCNAILTEKQLAWEEYHGLQPCYCEEWQEIQRLNKTIKNLR